MPIFSPDMTSQAIPQTRGLQFSGMKVENLGSTEYTLATIAVDVSGSTVPFRQAMETSIMEIVKACAHHPRVDSMMIRLVTFDTHVREIHGFKTFEDINSSDYYGCLGSSGGSTALFDATHSSAQAAILYAKTLTKNDFTVNGITFVITDGDDNASAATPLVVASSLAEALSGEHMMSHTSILIGVNDQTLDLHKVKSACGFNEYVSLGSVTATSLAKLGKIVSKSISVASTALNSGVAIPATHSLTF